MSQQLHAIPFALSVGAIPLSGFPSDGVVVTISRQAGQPAVHVLRDPLVTTTATRTLYAVNADMDVPTGAVRFLGTLWEGAASMKPWHIYDSVVGPPPAP